MNNSLVRNCLIVVVIGVLAALCIWVTVGPPAQSTADAPPAPGITTNAPTPEDHVAKNDTLSDATRPADEQVWAFEAAYSETDPAVQLKLLEKVATPQYIRDEYSAASIDVNELVVRVDRATSSFSIQTDSQNSYCYVTSDLELESFREDTLVASYRIRHTTIWVNTPDGWKVASEVR